MSDHPPDTPADAAADAGSTDRGVRLVNEFAEVVVQVVQTHNGVRLSISSPRSGHRVLLCPLELEALSWQDPEHFSELLTTPHGPE